MKEYASILDLYSQDGFSMYSTTIPAAQWGNRQIAETYLKRYWIPLPEYDSVCRPLQNTIFTNLEIGLPSMLFRSGYQLKVTRGGCLFVEEEFARLRECMLTIGEKWFFVIENTFGGRVKDPVFRMKFPSSITWSELTNGNFVSSVLLEMPHKEYGVFGESGMWGKYSANDFEFPLDLLGFKQEVYNIFIDILKSNPIKNNIDLPYAYQKSSSDDKDVSEYADKPACE